MVKYTMNKDFSFYIDLRKLSYFGLCLYSVVFILENGHQYTRYTMLYGVICMIIVWLEKVISRGRKKDFTIENGILRFINSFFIVLIGKYISPVIASSFGLMYIAFEKESNMNLLHIIGLLCIVIYSNLLFSNFITND